MLTHLHIQNFTLVDSLDIELNQGLTALTGETGAGKSILLDALSLTLGDRADADKVRKGSERADIHASFDLSTLPHAKKWLKANELIEDDECILRRTITKEGRSRAYINGQTVTLTQLRGLGEMLIDIHSQHEHQSLLKNTTHQRLLDEFADVQKITQHVKEAYKNWANINKDYLELKNSQDDTDARYQLLSYQVNELNQLELEEHEVDALEREQQTLSLSETVLLNCNQIHEICTNDESGLMTQLHQAIHLLSAVEGKPERLKNAETLLNSAIINIEEASNDITQHVDNYENNPERLAEVEQRLSDIYVVARKHKVSPNELYSLHQALIAELEQLKPKDEHIAILEQALENSKKEYDKHAAQLTQKRVKTANQLTKQVNEQLARLAMKHASLSIQLDTLSNPSQLGNEQVNFLIATQPNQAPKPLHKVASGGELSRVSLAIQVVVAQTSTTPTLVFDEVDVGIGGTTGDIVGRMLRELGENGQVFCVTHLAQVASKAHNHFRVEKTITKEHAFSELHDLDTENKVIEIARMMGGDITSEQTLAHAREVINAA